MATRVLNCKVGDKVVIPHYSRLFGFVDEIVDEAMKNTIFVVTEVNPTFVTENNIELIGFADIGLETIDGKEFSILVNNTQVEPAP